MIIREATESELPIIKEQRVLAYEEYAKLLPESHWLALKSAITADIDIVTGAELLIAEEGGEILGSVALFPARTDAYQGFVEAQDYPEIRMLAIMPEARKKGVGIALIKDCIARSKGNDAKYIGLHTGEFMKAAMKLYEKIGFERVPELDFVPADDGIVKKGYRYQIIE